MGWKDQFGPSGQGARQENAGNDKIKAGSELKNQPQIARSDWKTGKSAKSRDENFWKEEFTKFFQPELANAKLLLFFGTKDVQEQAGDSEIRT